MLLIFGMVLLVSFGVFRGMSARSQKSGHNRYGLWSDTQYVQQGRFRCYHQADHATEASVLTAQLNRFSTALIEQFGQQLSLTPQDEPTSVYLFGDMAQLREKFKQQFAGSIGNNGGFYNARRGDIVVVRGEGMIASACHETMHMVLDRWVADRSGSWSPWFNEGLATYFEQVDEGETDGKLTWGGRIPELLKRGKELVEDRQWLALATLTGATQAQFTGEDNLDYYAQSYLLVHYLRHADDGKYLPVFARYYDAERKGEQDGLSLAKLLGIPADELDRRLQTYVKSLAY